MSVRLKKNVYVCDRRKLKSRWTEKGGWWSNQGMPSERTAGGRVRYEIMEFVIAQERRTGEQLRRKVPTVHKDVKRGYSGHGLWQPKARNSRTVERLPSFRIHVPSKFRLTRAYA